MHITFALFFIFSLFLQTPLFAVAYQVQFEGVLTPEVEGSLRKASQLVGLLSVEPPTLFVLKKRAEADLLNLVTALRRFGYFDPHIHFMFPEEQGVVQVKVVVDTGPVYSISSLDVNLECDEESSVTPSYSLEDVIGHPAMSQVIFDAERELLEQMVDQGFPLVEVARRDISVDQESRGIKVVWDLALGPAARFGPIELVGLRKTQPILVLSKVAWCEGDPFDPDLIELTECALEKTGLFCSVVIEPQSEIGPDGRLPMQFLLREGYHRTIATGVSVNTQLGPGFFSRWEHRNVSGLGRRFSIEGDLWWKKQTGIMQAVFPDLTEENRRWIIELEAEKERTRGFTETFMSLFGYLEKNYTPCLKVSCGLGLKRLFTSGSDNNAPALLLKTPLLLRWSTASAVLDPQYGQTLKVEVTPSWQLLENQFLYSKEEATWSYYLPIAPSSHHILAFKTVFGAILGGNPNAIPPPEKLYSGTESTLRGYKFMTVSPLNEENKPIGGLSMLVFSGELRLKLKHELGFAFFYEIGNVYADRFPDLENKQLQSMGGGLRYHTLLGPIRADVAVPLNRRAIDPPLQFYLSIGQAF